MNAASNARPIGVFDSGFGGLTVFHEIEKACPSESIHYFGDTARLPYGTKSHETVTRYALQVLDFFKSQEVKLLVVACNTVSSIALDRLKRSSPFPIVGVAEPGARRAAHATRNGRIGVIGTEATVGSGAYELLIHRFFPKASVRSRACPLFVPLVEEGWTEGEITERVIETYLAPLKESGIDTLVLGCTHYPLLRSAIGRYLGEGITLVDSAEQTALEVKRLLAEMSLSAPGSAPASPEFFVTDSAEKFEHIGGLFLRRALGKVHHVDL